MQILSWNPDIDGVFSQTALIDKLEKSGYSCTCYTYPAGTCFPEHEHDDDKIDAVLQGCFRISAGGKDFILHPGDSIMIPAGTRHSAGVIGEKSVVAIDAVKPSGS